MSAPLITVVIPVFNAEPYLALAIESALAQSYRPAEVIVIDDGSTDESPAIASRYDVQLIRQPNRGVSAARNAGIRAARGGMIAFLDADDLWPPDRLAIQAHHLQQRPELGFVMAHAVQFLEPGVARPAWLTREWIAGVGKPASARGRSQPRDVTVPVAHPGTLLARTSVFGEVGRFDESRDMGEDLDWLMRAADAGIRHELLPDVVLHHRLHSSNASHRLDDALSERLRIARESAARKRQARTPLVSVVIPAYNAEAFLAEAIESVLAQDYKPVEVIVVDDGSTDRTAAVASRYPVMCLMQANGGPPAARNAGVAAARGSLVSFLDADDLWMPSKLSTEVAYLLARPELDYVLVHMQRSLRPGAEWPPGTPARWFDEPQPGTLPSAGLVRRTVLKRIGPFDTDFRIGSDTEWQARAADAGVRWELLPEALVEYRIHGGNMSYDNLAMKREMFQLLRESLVRKRMR